MKTWFQRWPKGPSSKTKVHHQFWWCTFYYLTLLENSYLTLLERAFYWKRGNPRTQRQGAARGNDYKADSRTLWKIMRMGTSSTVAKEPLGGAPLSTRIKGSSINKANEHALKRAPAERINLSIEEIGKAGRTPKRKGARYRKVEVQGSRLKRLKHVWWTWPTYHLNRRRTSSKQQSRQQST